MSPKELNCMELNFMETRFEALDAIGNALKKGRVSFGEASKLRDLARAGRISEVKEHLTPLVPTRRP